MKRSFVRAIATAVALAGAVSMAACSTPATESTAEPDDLTPIVVGLQPITPFANVPFGIENGIFEKYGLDVEVQIITEATTIPPAVLAGQLQFAAWSYASFTSLANSGLPLITVGPGDVAGTDLETDYTQLLVLPDSGFEETADLAGATIATNSLNSLSQIQTKVALDNAGVDPDGVSYVPIPYSSQGSALESGQVDAIQVAEPFLTQYKRDLGALPLDALDAAIMPDLPVSTWFTSQQYAAQNPDIVAAFQRALRESSAYAQSHTDEIREFITELTGVDPETAKHMILPTWVTEVDLDKIQSVADTMQEFGAIPERIDMSDYVLESPDEG